MESVSRSLYLKWRSQTFDDVIAQEHVTRTLKNAVKLGQVSHAYLFCGPRGTGKTSTARILAKAVNCESEADDKPCNKCRSCISISQGRAMDLIEIDAASNRGIDDVRELREKVRFLPAEAKRKVYIIDEVHMMTSEAFNALLKTLEEPPERAMFILATTEAHKVPPTIVSRCQRFDFRPIPLRATVDRLQHICQAESLNISTETLELIARHATGSLRDAVSLLDQLAVYNDGVITPDTAYAILGATTIERVEQFVDALAKRDMAEGIHMVNEVVNDGADLRQFNKEVVDYLRDLLLLKASPRETTNIDLSPEALSRLRSRAEMLSLEEIFRLINIFSGNDVALKMGRYAQLPLEMGVVDFVLGGSGTARRDSSTVSAAARTETRTPVKRDSAPPRLQVVPPPPAQPIRAEASPASEAGNTEPSKGGETPKTRQETVHTAPAEAETEQDQAIDLDPELARAVDLWPRILEDIRPLNRSVEALLKDCAPVAMEGSFLVLGFQYEFHKTKIEDIRNRSIVESVASKVMGGKCNIKCVLAVKGGGTEQKSPRQQREEVRNDPRVKAAMNIFNAKIVDGQSTTE
ncbi:MAG: DNA polymerase III subunit gamma/tau [Chloroflexi bacterium]|nr:DNA polymerase III subunit gamma/tau [Chloroflexota bacterium]